MNFTNPRKLSILIAAILVGFNAIVIGVAHVVFQIELLLVFGLSVILLFVFSYLIYRYSLEKFIYERIKLLYKTMYVLKSPKKEKAKFFRRTDLIEDVNDKIIKWAENKKEEIEQLRKSDFFRREYIGNVSHELKTPIFNIQGYILTLLDGGLEDPAINRQYLLRAEKSINRMISIVEDLETITQFESGVLQLKPGYLDMVQLSKEVMEALEIKAGKKNIKIIFGAGHETPVQVFADKERVRQVLINLVDNSIKYGQPGCKTKISFFDMEDYWLIEVADNGIGIDQKDIPRIFERFYRVDKSRSREQGGSGLGLSIVKHIIEAHNQTINARSMLNKGTTFGFTLAKKGKSE